jgi:hypothetical protein
MSMPLPECIPFSCLLVGRRSEAICGNNTLPAANDGEDANRRRRHQGSHRKEGQGGGHIPLFDIMKYRRISIGRELGSAAVEQRMTEIALLMRKTFPDFYWERCAADNNGRTNRMHVLVEGRDEPICFTDRELISYSSEKRRTMIDYRMHAVLSRLFHS